jgi:hypothetical protein
MILLLLALLAAPARAQDPAKDEATDDSDEAEEASPAPAATPGPSRVASTIVTGYEFKGRRLDGDDRLAQYLATVAPLGSPFIEVGPSDAIGTVLVGTLPRLEKALQAIGYRARLSTRAANGGVVIVATGPSAPPPSRRSASASSSSCGARATSTPTCAWTSSPSTRCRAPSTCASPSIAASGIRWAP